LDTATCYAIAFAAEDAQGMKRAAALASGMLWAEDWMSQAEALAAADRGQIRLAHQLSRRARMLAVSVGQTERAARYESALAVDEVLFGYPAEGIRAANEALRTSHGRDVEYTAALAFGLAGEVGQSDALRRDLHDRFPEDTVVNRIYLPVLSAVLGMAKGNAPEAVEALQVTASGEMAMVDDGSAMLGNVHSPYIEARPCYESARQRRASQNSTRLWNIPESVRRSDWLACSSRSLEAIALGATPSRLEAHTRRSSSDGPAPIQIRQSSQRLGVSWTRFTNYGL
jgi:hypothetical protein